MRTYEGNDNYGQSKSNYVDKISKMERNELLDETKDKIWLSAYANNNPRSDYHWQVDACYDEWKKRNDLAGYEKAYRLVAKSV